MKLSAALSWNQLADEYDKTHRDRPARTLPLDVVWEWAERNERFHVVEPEGTIHLILDMKTTADAAPATVNIGNWDVGGDAFAKAFGTMLVKVFEAMQAKSAATVMPASAAKPAGKQAKRRARSEVRNEME